MEPHHHLEPNPTTSLFQMNLDAQNSYNLRSAAGWGRVLGVVGIVLGIIFCLLCAIAMTKLNSYDGGYSRRGGFDDIFGGSATGTKMGLWMMIITGIIFILGGVFSFHFGSRVSAALKSNDQEGLNRGFAALRNYYAVRSITLIIVLLLFLLGFAGSM